MEDWKKPLYILTATQFLAMMGMNFVVPFLPFFIRSLGVSDPDDLARWSGLVFSGTFMTAFVATPLWGSLGDKYGRKLMVVRALFGLGISQALIGLSQNVVQLFVFRLVQGAVSGFIASNLALVSSMAPRDRLGYSLGLLQSATAGGTVVGPFVGGLLADLIGYRAIFFVVASLCFIGGIVVINQVHEVRHPSDTITTVSPLHNFRLMFTDRNLRIVAITLVAAQMAVQVIEPVFALFIEGFIKDAKFLSTVAGSIFAIAGIFMLISGPWWGKRNDRIGFKQSLLFALTGTGVSYFLHVVVPNLVLLSGLRAILGFARGGILPTLYSLTNSFAPADRKSAMIGIAASLTILGSMLGPLVGGYVGGHFGINASFVLSSILLVLTAFLVWRLLVEPRRSGGESPTTSVAV
jgi:DHA1 family multidrug resistance protein-like MFS transporter